MLVRHQIQQVSVVLPQVLSELHFYSQRKRGEEARRKIIIHTSSFRHEKNDFPKE